MDENMSEGLANYFWELEDKIQKLEKIAKKYEKIKVQRAAKQTRIDRLKSALTDATKAHAKLHRKFDDLNYYRYKMETIVHRMNIAEEVRMMRKELGKELKEQGLFRPRTKEMTTEWKTYLQDEVPWRIE
jgi:septal ring factor EnvC (AmiA/AmiB activator)